MQFLSQILGGKEPIATNNALNSGSLSGSGSREDGVVSFGFSLLQGKRGNMEDYHVAQFIKDAKARDVIGCFGVFDGHGGPHAADFVRRHLFSNLMANQQFCTNVSEALVEAFISTDKQYLESEGSASRNDGCTAVTAVVIGKTLYVANVGDSRAVLCRDGKAVAMSEDHKPNLQSERQRIEDAGGVVVWAGTWRVGGVLAVSRAFGDRPLKAFVVAKPDVRCEILTPKDEFLLLASDGVWDVVTNQEAIELVRSQQDAEKAAKRITDEAMNRGSNDNISCIVVRFRVPS